MVRALLAALVLCACAQGGSSAPVADSAQLPTAPPSPTPTEVPTPSPTESPTPAMLDMESSLGIVEITVGAMEATGGAAFVREDAADGTPRWVATTSGGIVTELTGEASDDPDFHFLKSMTFLMPVGAESSEGASDALRNFAFAGDLATEGSATPWITEVTGQDSPGSFTDQRHFTVTTLGGGEQIIYARFEGRAAEGTITITLSARDF